MASSVVVRSYKLRLYPNRDKFDTARYTNKRFNDYLNMFVGKFFFGSQGISTKGMGSVANQACYKAHKIARGLIQLHKKAGIKVNVPFFMIHSNYAEIEKSKNSRFDYWIRVSNLWTKAGVVRLPAKSHRALNQALKNGWQLSDICEFKIIKGDPYAIVFVSKKAPQTLKTKKVIGCDVGIIHSVVTSEGHKGHGLSRIMKIQKYRQGNKHKSYIKQILDREAKAIIGRSVNTQANIAVENPKRLATLRSGSLQGWARSHFANRLHILGQENGVKVIDISPYQTSITCFKCGTIDKRSRAGRIFHCVKCGHQDHADINAAKVIALRGREAVRSERKNSD